MSEDVDIRILHVDDQPDLAEVTAEMLEREDERFTVEVATSASDGLTWLSDTEYDCIVSDYEMPGQTGIEFLETVRETYPDLPFILYTGKGSEEVASDAISAGVTDYLQKAAGTSEYTVLANRVRNAVDKYRTQTELADSQKRLTLFFEQSPLGVVGWDENFNVVRLNDAAEDILGYTEAELAGHSWEKIVPESDRDDVGIVVSDLLGDKGGYHIVNDNVRNDGERIVCEWHNRVVTDDAGDVVAIFSQFQEVTERRERQRRFEAVFNNAYTLSGLMEPDGTVIEANETALSFGGLDRDDVVGKPLWDTAWMQASDETKATVKQAVEQAREGELFRGEIRIQGSERDAVIDFSLRPVTDDRGEVTLLVPEGRDITERKAQERENQRRRHRLEQILKTVPACVVQLDESGDFVFANDRAEEVLGLTKDALTQRAYNDPEWKIRAPDGTPIPDENLPFRQVKETGEPLYDFRHIIEWPDGSEKLLSVNGAPLFDDGSVESVVFALADITDSEAQKRKLRETSARLAALYENSPDLINVLDSGGRIVDVNERFCTELGYAEEVLLGEPIWEFDQMADDEDVEELLSGFSEGERRKFNGRYERSDGSTFPVEVHLLRLDMNDRDRFLAISRDITERRQR